MTTGPSIEKRSSLAGDRKGVDMTTIPLPRRMHRIATVRNQECISLRTVASKTHVPTRALRQQEHEWVDLPLSALYTWQEALDVPVADLLVEPDDNLSPGIAKRARLVKVMKTVASMITHTEDPTMKRLLVRLRDDLVDIMPELKTVVPWPSVGQRRTLNEYGRTYERQFPQHIFHEELCPD